MFLGTFHLVKSQSSLFLGCKDWEVIELALRCPVLLLEVMEEWVSGVELVLELVSNDLELFEGLGH